ncbi:hypothetical protein [Polaromonas sp.]|uniref:hypothetical protein n=1 Tax=Polaromonas sp. TaxID=1869339 RepID=UPI0017F9D17E|nr:hypothetical protein [Polaromonas sp.]NML84681.1 hypothetical protein [Polaromonas sp.]
MDKVRPACGSRWMASLLLGAPHPSGIATPDDIRQAMLQALDSIVGPESARAPDDRRIDRRIDQRIRYCQDANTLWHLRSELMQVPSAHHGEREARCQLDSISALFDGLLPFGMHSNRANLRLR